MDDDGGLIGVPRQIALMVGLGGIEALERRDLGDDGAPEGVGPLQWVDVGLGDALLLVVGVEHGRAVLGAGVRPLAVELGGIVRDREDHLPRALITPP